MYRRTLVILTGLTLILAACGGDTATTTTAGDTSTTAAAGDTTGATACEGVTLTFIGLAGEEGEAELADWRAENNVTLEGSWPGDWTQLISAILVGQEFDLATIPYHQGQRMIASGILQPLDTSRLSHWDDMVPGLREHPSLRDPDGNVYGAPIAWGDGPYVYHPERAPNPPGSIMDLAEPEWANRFVTFDSPDQLIYLVALNKGFTEVPLLTPEQLEEVGVDVARIVANAAAFNTGYQDATDRLIAGDIDLALGGWQAMLTWAAEDGVTLDFGYFDESPGGWWDGLAIPSTAKNVDCAYEYIDRMLSPEVNAEVGTNLISAVVNTKSIDMVGAGADIYEYDIVMGVGERMFESTTPPEEVPDGYASYQDWIDLWAAIKS